jgi:hypothetical protein
MLKCEVDSENVDDGEDIPFQWEGNPPPFIDVERVAKKRRMHSL